MCFVTYKYLNNVMEIEGNEEISVRIAAENGEGWDIPSQESHAQI